MTILGFYVLFALTTAIVSIYELLMPITRDMIANNDHVEIAKNPILYIVHFCISLLLAPLIFLCVIVPKMGEGYRKGLYNGLTEKQ